MDQSYQLEYPIVRRLQARGAEGREETIEWVPIRRLKAKDLRTLDTHSGQIAQSLALIGALTGLSPQLVDELDGEDIQGLGDMLADFFPERQGTGEASSET